MKVFLPRVAAIHHAKHVNTLGERLDDTGKDVIVKNLASCLPVYWHHGLVKACDVTEEKSDGITWHFLTQVLDDTGKHIVFKDLASSLSVYMHLGHFKAYVIWRGTSGVIVAQQSWVQR